MSVKLMSEVWGLDLSHEHQLILLAMADHANDEGESCFPGVARLAWKTGYSERQVQRILGTLKDEGLIEPVAYVTGGRGRATNYHLHLEKGVIKSPFMAERVTSQGEKGDIAVSPQPSVKPEPSVRPKPLRVRARDETWDVLVELYGEPQDPRLRGSMNLACKELKAQHANPEQIRDRYELAPLADLGWAVVTPLAMAKHWGLRLQASLRSPSVADKLLEGARLLETRRGTDGSDEAGGKTPRRLPGKSSRPRDR